MIFTTSWPLHFHLPVFAASTLTSTNSRYYGPNNLAEFSSLGPAFDGRMKPDIVAPGVNIMSANSDANMCARALLASATRILVALAL